MDEFELLAENAADAGVPWSGGQPVARVDDAGLSAIRWGAGSPEAVFVHGGAQNAHTWDTVVLALGRSALAVDLPGHGRSAWRDDHDYSPARLAATLAPVVERHAPAASVVVGMSLGGLAAIRLAADRPDLVRRLVVVDVTPGVDARKSRAVIAFTSGPARFPSFDALLDRTLKHHPGRSPSSIRRGLLHNAREEADGSWTWRYDPVRLWSGSAADIEFSDLWDAVARIRCPVLLVRGARSPVVDDADVAEFLRRRPGTRVEVVAGAGHSVQGDRPVELARLVAAFTEEAA